MPIAQGQILNNRYRIITLLGQGGFGAVHRAWDTNLEVPVAVKENLDISPAAQKQFKREAQMLFNLHHPNLPRVHDYFVISNQGQYLIMDFVEGQDLGEMLKTGPLPEARVLPWIIQVCDALSYLHSQNPPVIHRDIKPGNIRITPDGKAMLVDFGISKVYDPALATTVGARAVTPGYSPPEQYGKGVTDIRSDLYALGATLYHLLTGQLPPDSVDIVTRNTPPPPSVLDLNSSISKTLGEAIAKAMALDREERWASANEFKKAITTQPSEKKQKVEKATFGGDLKPPPVPSPIALGQTLPSTPGRRIPWFWLAIIGGLLVIIGFMVALKKLPALINQAPPVYPTEMSLVHTARPSDFTDQYGVRMKFIPAGEFRMGSENSGEDESPVHTVFLDAFYMDIYEVTNSLYALCVSSRACTEPRNKNSYTRETYFGDATYNDYPVINVDWNQAQEFCDWRGSRLPTEAEWEKAARGGLEGKLYPWGDQELDCSRVNFIECEGDANRVGSYPPNGYGLFDMAGNVWEWVWDVYSESYYASSSAQNPTGPSSGSFRILRGGCWGDINYNLRVSIRYRYNPVDVHYDVGFRCARTP